MSTHSRSPVPNPVRSFWNAEPRPLDDYRSTADLPPTADIVIIGAGFAGAATAYHILHQAPNPPPSIVLLEARKICSGATGRNGGHVKPDVYFSIPKYAGTHGTEAAVELANFEAEHVHAMKEFVEAEEIDCDFHLTRSVDVYLDPVHASQTEAAYKELVKTGAANLRDVDFTPKQDAERISGVKGAQCCFSFTAAHLWPSKMIHQLVQKLIGQGLSVHANTPVSSVLQNQGSNSSSTWTVRTPRGDINASKVVYATNAYTAQVLPEYAGSIVPVRGTCSHIASPKGAGTPHLVNTYGIRHGGPGYDYLIPRADGSIVVGGGLQTYVQDPGRWLDNVRDDELISEAVPYFDGYMQRRFRGWEDSGAKVDKIWTGIMGFSSDSMPHVGEVPGKPGQYVIAGFSGHGMPAILLSSKGLASMVRDGTSFEDTGLPRLLKTTQSRIEANKSLSRETLQSLFGGDSKPKL